MMKKLIFLLLVSAFIPALATAKPPQGQLQAAQPYASSYLGRGAPSPSASPSPSPAPSPYNNASLSYIETPGPSGGMQQELFIKQQQYVNCCGRCAISGSGQETYPERCCPQSIAQRVQMFLLYADADDFQGGGMLDTPSECVLTDQSQQQIIDPLWGGQDIHSVFSGPWWQRWTYLNLANANDGDEIQFDTDSCETGGCQGPYPLRIPSDSEVESVILLQGFNAKDYFIAKGMSSAEADDAVIKLQNAISGSPYFRYIEIKPDNTINFILDPYYKQYLVLYEIDKAITGDMTDPEYRFDDGVYWGLLRCGDIDNDTPPPAVVVEVRDNIGCNNVDYTCADSSRTDDMFPFPSSRSPDPGFRNPVARMDIPAGENYNLKSFTAVVTNSNVGGYTPPVDYEVRLWSSQADVESDPACQDPTKCSHFTYFAPTEGPTLHGSTDYGFGQPGAADTYVVVFDLENPDASAGNIDLTFLETEQIYITVVTDDAGGGFRILESTDGNNPSDRYGIDSGNPVWMDSDQFTFFPDSPRASGRIAVRLLGESF